MNSLACHTARAAIFGISLAFTSIWTSSAESTRPCATAGKQPNPHFSHSSSHAVDRQHSVVTDKVCNHDDDGLVFSWDKAFMIRGVNNPLQPGAPCDIQSYPANVDAVKQDNNAPIHYTQSGRIKRAGICAEAGNITSVSVGPLISSLKTSFVRNNDNPVRVTIQTSVYLDRSQETLRFRLRTTHPGVIVGLGSMSSFADALSSNEQFLRILEQHSSPVGGFYRVRDQLNNDDIAWLSPSLREDAVLFFSNIDPDVYIDFSIPVSESILLSIGQREAAMFVVDMERNLIATGKFVLLTQAQ